MGSGSHLAAAHGREAARSEVRFMEESGNAVVRLARFGGLIVGDESRNQEEKHMGARCFGGVAGTGVLILLGYGVVANVLLKRSKAEAAGWLAIAAGWAFAVVFGVFTAIACGSPDDYINPAFTLGMAVSSGDFSKFWPFLVAQVSGADRGRGPGLGALLASLASDRRCGCKAPLLLDDARYPQF